MDGKSTILDSLKNVVQDKLCGTSRLLRCLALKLVFSIHIRLVVGASPRHWAFRRMVFQLGNAALKPQFSFPSRATLTGGVAATEKAML